MDTNQGLDQRVLKSTVGVTTQASTQALVRNGLLVLGASLFLAISAQISWRLPISIVPVSLQTLSVLLVGAALGRRKGALAVFAYLTEGLSGLPVFAEGRFGIGHLLGPTGGYLVGFVVAAYVVGLLQERGFTKTFPRSFATFFVGHASIYVIALPWLGEFVGRSKAVAMGFLPFAAGDLLKVLFAALLVTGVTSLRSTQKDSVRA